MKTKVNFFSIIALLVLVIACSSDADDALVNPIPTPVLGKTTFKQNGNLIESDSTVGILYTTVINGKRMLDVNVYKSGNVVLEMHMPPSKGNFPVALNIGSTTTSWLTYIEYPLGSSTPSDYFDGDTGSMNLTTCDTVTKNINGAFSFSGDNSSATTTKNITEGKLVVSKLKRQ